LHENARRTACFVAQEIDEEPFVGRLTNARAGFWLDKQQPFSYQVDYLDDMEQITFAIKHQGSSRYRVVRQDGQE
jgi:hypothetical protein